MTTARAAVPYDVPSRGVPPGDAAPDPRVAPAGEPVRFASTAPPGEVPAGEPVPLASTAPAELATTAPATDVPAGAPRAEPGGAGPLVVRLPGRTVLLVAGLPGAGKSTLLAALTAPPGATVLDSGTARAVVARRLPAGTPYPAYRWLTHLVHRAGVVRACLGPSETVVVHLPATAPRVRAVVRALARLTGRAPHLLWLDVPPEQALAGQHARGRVIRSRTFAVHAGRAARTTALLRAGDEPGWTSVRTTDRSGARRGLVLAK
ncbi:AAA family ATPase [Pseudonocardia sp. C8]|uniref:AAA family ATPase n=1 Tax=Pseudonocardia sp. C8 TaxID=2762759 RepID=UPI0016434382|nr:AAA family ATPase [Pseudonocardia sp. C8]MBC3190758.1 AAA family ATPase [Pseudonocardia sp. C8]